MAVLLCSLCWESWFTCLAAGLHVIARVKFMVGQILVASDPHYLVNVCLLIEVFLKEKKLYS